VTAKAPLLRLAAAYVRGRPLWCSWQLTRRCGSLCLFCDHRAEAAGRELDLAGCRRVVEQLRHLGCVVVSLTGGEPFLRTDLPEVVSLLAESHVPLLTTHGWLVSPERARAVWQAGLQAATIRLDSADPAQHDAAVGLPGAHARAVAALAALAETRTEAGQRVNVKASLPQADPGALPGLLALAARHGASVTVEPAFPVAGGQVVAASAGLLEMKRRHPNLLSGAAYLRRVDEAMAGGVPGCAAARSFLNVDHQGRVSKCVEFQGEEDRVGDLLGEEAAEVVPRLRRVARENTCRACWSASRGELESLYTARGLLGALPGLLWS
jgi:MoaA/NifB/PqqE/SkfB family radical SAM enzyme